MLLFEQFWTIFDIMHFSWEFKNENIPEIMHLRYKIHRNPTLRAFIDDFRHNAFLLKNHKMKIRWNHQFCVEMWPKSLKYHTKIDVIGFLYFFYENLVCNLQKLFDNSRFVLQQSSGEIPQSTLWFQKNPET